MKRIFIILSAIAFIGSYISLWSISLWKLNNLFPTKEIKIYCKRNSACDCKDTQITKTSDIPTDGLYQLETLVIKTHTINKNTYIDHEHFVAYYLY